jgi:hypothetical protein
MFLILQLIWYLAERVSNILYGSILLTDGLITTKLRMKRKEQQIQKAQNKNSSSIILHVQ